MRLERDKPSKPNKNETTIMRGPRGPKALVVMEGQEVTDKVDVDATVAFLRQVNLDKEHGLIPHHGRKRKGSGPTAEDKPYRNVHRRGSWKT